MKPNPIISVVKLMRPKQYTKNAIVFGALIFSGEFFNMAYLANTALGFLAFCLISSCVYILNDIADREKDRLHPKKKNRPIASGAVSVPFALVLFVILLLGTVLFSFWRGFGFGVVVCAYFLVNLAYSMRLKRVVIVDIMCVSLPGS